MKIIIAIIICLLSLSNVSKNIAQVQTILDSKYQRFFVGFKIQINAGYKTKVLLISEDSLEKKVVLYDSVVSESQEIIFLQSGDSYEGEKAKYPNNNVCAIPILESGVYFLKVEYQKRVILIK
jgi:hypothetical protein